jgi:type IV pilus assembly protein PilB
MITSPDIIEHIVATADLSKAEAERLEGAIWEIIGREISVGEEVEVPSMGHFFTVKYPGHEAESGEIGLPTIEPEFEPASELVERVEKAMKDHPEFFADEHPEPEADEAPLREVKPPTEEEMSQEKVVKKERPLGRASAVTYEDISKLKVEKEVLSLLPLPLAQKYSAVPIDLKEGELTVAMINPEDFDAVQLIRKETGLSIKPVLTSRDDLQFVLDQYTGLQAEVQEVIASSEFGISKQDLAAAKEEQTTLEEDNEDAPTAKIVGSLLKRAVKERASDIHIEPYEHKVVVRFRIDGILMVRVELPKEIQDAMAARLKILANLKIDEQRLPQDGRFSMNLDRREVDFRISTIPVVFGEKVVMRILDKQQGIRDLTEVGLQGSGLEILTKNIERSHGMILVTGPTGSGKTTTLYAVLGRLMKPDVNILTLEDPVEYRIESINQSQVHNDIGYSFANGLRAVVRQDPDVVMLGEIRDKETAEMAVQAALTGHVVLSTLHTNDAAGAFPRLIDMGIEPFLITSSIHTVVAQRLARKLDPEHRQERKLTGNELEEVVAEIEKMPDAVQKQLKDEGVDLKNPVVYQPKEENGSTGYIGRMGIFEVLDMTEPIRNHILERKSGTIIREEAVKNGMLTMVQDGIAKAVTGQISLEEVWRVTRE